MSLGQVIRKVLGPAVDPVARAYRSYYVDLDDFARHLGGLQGVSSILEIGCGDGHLCESLSGQFEDATVLGIDIAENPGTLYRGRAEGVEFREAPAEDLVDEGLVFDLVVLCDVLHHVPVELRDGLVGTAWALTNEVGHLAVKDWVSTRNLATGLAYTSDRFVTGDTPAFFSSRQILEDLVVGRNGVVKLSDGWVRPHQNNWFLVGARNLAT